MSTLCISAIRSCNIQTRRMRSPLRVEQWQVRGEKLEARSISLTELQSSASSQQPESSQDWMAYPWMLRAAELQS